MSDAQSVGYVMKALILLIAVSSDYPERPITGAVPGDMPTGAPSPVLDYRLKPLAVKHFELYAVHRRGISR
jgi:hypothetical protein